EAHLEAAIRLFVDPGDIRFEQQLEMLTQSLGETGADVGIEVLEQPVAAVGQKGFAAHTREDRGQLHCNVATTDDQHAVWQLRQIEYLVGRNGVRCSRNGGNVGPAARSHHDALHVQPFSLNLYRVGANDPGTSLENLNSGLLQ